MRLTAIEVAMQKVDNDRCDMRKWGGAGIIVTGESESESSEPDHGEAE